MIYGRGETPLEVGDDGKVIITRDEAEVFKPETIASFEGKSITITHPEEFVDPSNWKELTVGLVQHVRRGDGDQKNDLIADLLITDAIAIGLVKKGLREVSCGYEAEYIQSEVGRGIQQNIIGNHLALVEEGRAGSEYAINDGKNGKGVPAMKKKFNQKLRSLFAKVADEAEKMEDESPEAAKEGEKAKDASEMYDELIKMCDALAEKVKGLAPKKADDAEEPKKEEEKKAGDEEPAKEEKKADDAEVAPSVEDRLKAIEAALAKIMEGEATDEDGEEEEASDAEEDKEESEDEEMDPSETGDTASRAEILAPGISMSKDVKVQALKKALGTEEGKKVIDSLTGGKAPAFDSADKVNTLFIAASELLKVKRGDAFVKAKTSDFVSNIGVREGAMTPEALNKKNQEYWSKK